MSRNHIVKYFQIGMLVLLLAIILTGCATLDQFFNTPEKEIKIVVGDGLSLDGDKYVAEVGKEFSLSIDAGKELANYDVCLWRLSQNGTLATISSDKVLKYTFEEYTDEVFEFFVVVNGTASINRIPVVVAPIKEVEPDDEVNPDDDIETEKVVTDVNIVVDGGLQKDDDLYVATVGQKVLLSLAINENAPVNLEYQWYVETAGTSSLVGSLSSLTHVFDTFGENTYKIWAVVNGVESDKLIVKVDPVKEVTGVTVNIDGGLVDNGTHYVATVGQSINLSLTLSGYLPDEIEYLWKLSDQHGTAVIGESASLEYVFLQINDTAVTITATVNGVESNALSMVVEPVREVYDVGIAVENGLVAEGAQYVATLGQQFTLSLELNNYLPDDIVYEWKLFDGQTTVVVGNQDTLNYTFDTNKVGVYVFSATANGVESQNTISVSIKPQVTEVEILAQTGITQTGESSYIASVGVEFTLGFSVNENSPAEMNCVWYKVVGGNKTEIGRDNTVSFKFVDASVEECDFAVSVDGVEDSISVTVENLEINYRISADVGFEQIGEDQYIITAGEQFALSMVGEGQTPTNVEYNWFIYQDGEKIFEDTTAITISYKINTAVKSIYKVYGYVNGVECANVITFRFGFDVSEAIIDVVGGENTEKTGENSYEIIYQSNPVQLSVAMTISDFSPATVNYRWYMISGIGGQGVEILDFQNATTMTVSLSLGTYVIYGTANGVESNRITVDIVNNIVATEIIAESGLVYVDEKVYTATVGEEFTLSIHCETLGLETTSYLWALGVADSQNAIGTGQTLTYVFDEYTDEIQKIYARVDDGEWIFVEITLIQPVEPEDKRLEKVEICLEDGATAIGSGLETQYYQEVTNGLCNSVTVALSIDTVRALDSSSNIEWIVRNAEGTTNVEGMGYEISFVPIYGETMVKAVVDNIESFHIVILAFTKSDYQDNEKYILDVRLWVDGVENSYITDQTDLNRFVEYAVSTRRVCELNAEGTSITAEGAKNGFDFAVAEQFQFMENGDESGARSKALEWANNAESTSISTMWGYNYVLYLTEKTEFMTPSGNYTPSANVVQKDMLVCMESIASGERRTELPIDDNPEYGTAITNSQMLYRVLGWGYKPTFDSSFESQKMKALYDSIRQVAIEYMSEDMTEYQKVRVIYEWIVNYVDYDYAIYDSDISFVEGIKYNAYSLEGVFTNADGEGNGQAVCDGRAKAFVALCGVEDIKAVRVVGMASGGGHAWNKVLIDANGDGKKEWYICDTTWGDGGSLSNDTYYERINKGYFLVDDQDIASTHSASEQTYNPVCNTEIDYYALTVFENGDKDFDLYIESDAELKNALAYASAKGVSVEIKVSTAYCATTQDFVNKVVASATGATSYSTVSTTSGYVIYTVNFA